MDPFTIFPPGFRKDEEDSLSVAENAFNAAKKHFEQSGVLSDQEIILMSDASTIDDVQQKVAESLAKYEAKNKSSKTRKWLQKASETICHYGAVLDVFVQHHPEYVALVWGTMKLLFTGVVDHGETLQLLGKSNSQIADRLPRFKLASQLFPTAQMQQAIETLYSCILEFLVRAHGWCHESKISHIYHSYTRPHALRYKDLLERITSCSNNIIELAAISSHAELRLVRSIQDDQGRKLDLIITLLEASGFNFSAIAAQISAFQSLQQSAQLDTNQRLSGIQLAQALTSLSPSYEDPDNCYKRHLFLRNRRAFGIGPTTSTNEFWLSPKLVKWSSCHKSGLVILKGTFTSRLAMQDFCVNVIQTLAASAVPVVWALISADRSTGSLASTTELMKYITFQALRLGGQLRTEQQMALRYSQFHTATSSKDWLDLFKKIVETLGGQIYIVVDLAMVDATLENVQGNSFIRELKEMLDGVYEEARSTKIKVVVLVYEAEWSNILPDEASDSIVLVKLMRRDRRPGNTMRRPLASIQIPSNTRGKTGRNRRGQ